MAQLTDVDIAGLSLEEIASQMIDEQSFTLQGNVSTHEAAQILNNLFSCQSHQYTYDGQTIINIVDTDFFNDLF